jgi:hypothetical protein
LSQSSERKDARSFVVKETARPSPGTIPSHGTSLKLSKQSPTKSQVSPSMALDAVEKSQSEAPFHALSFLDDISRSSRRCSI